MLACNEMGTSKPTESKYILQPADTYLEDYSKRAIADDAISIVGEALLQDKQGSELFENDKWGKSQPASLPASQGQGLNLDPPIEVASLDFRTRIDEILSRSIFTYLLISPFLLLLHMDTS